MYTAVNYLSAVFDIFFLFCYKVHKSVVAQD